MEAKGEARLAVVNHAARNRVALDLGTHRLLSAATAGAHHSLFAERMVGACHRNVGAAASAARLTGHVELQLSQRTAFPAPLAG